MRERRVPDRATSLTIVLVILSFVLMTLDIRSEGGGVMGTFRSGVQTIFTPVQAAASSVIDPVIDLVDGVANLAGLRDENQRLRDRINELESRLDEVGTLEGEVQSLRRILRLTAADEALPKIAAQIIARGDAFDASFRINAGTADGVLIGNPVVDDTGALIGTVTEVTDRTATVVPIIAPAADGVRVKSQTGEVGILRGRGSSNLMDYQVLDAKAPVLVGYLLTTAGSERYPGGIKVAKVVEDALPEAQRITTTAEPLADFGRLDFVAVLQWSFSTSIESTTTTTTTVPEEGSTEGGTP